MNQNNNNRDIYSNSYHYTKKRNIAVKKKNRKKKLMYKTLAVSGVLVILLSTVVIIAAWGNNSQNTVADTEKPINNEESIQEISAAAAEASVQPTSDKPIYSTDSLFGSNLTKISSEDVQYLNENVTAEFVVLYDATTDEIIYEKNAVKKCYPASTTKLLTAIVASSIMDKDQIIIVGDEIELIGEESSIAGLQIGDTLTFEMLLDALLLPSGNDAAYTIAVNTAKIYKNDDTLSNKEAISIFMELVNDAAKQLTATDTHFTAPDGWHNDNHYTTAKDLAKIAGYAKTVPIIQKSVSKAYAEWELLSGGTATWYNTNQLILGDSEVYSPYIDGMKTGFTDEAGSSVIASATIQNHSLIAVVMNGETLYKKYEDANLLFKAGFDVYNLDYIYGYNN